MQGLHAQGWWGHSANLITQGLHAGVACTRVVGTLSQSDYTGVARNGCTCRGCMRKGGGDTQLISLHRSCVQGLHVQGLRTRVACTGVALSQSDYTGVARNGCVCRGCAQGWWGHSVNQITQGLHARVACSRVMGTLSQSDYTGVVHKGCMCRVVCRGCTQGVCVQGLLFVLGYHWLPLATIDLVGDNREFEV